MTLYIFTTNTGFVAKRNNSCEFLIASLEDKTYPTGCLILTHSILVDSSTGLLDESICDLGVGSLLSLFFLFMIKNPVSKQ